MPRPILKHPGKVIRGKLNFYNVQLWNQQLDALEGKEYDLVIKEKHKKPTLDQFGYYRGGILTTCHSSDIFMHFDKPDDIHENYFAPKFLSYTVMVQLPNEKYELKKVRSMADLTREETAIFIDRVLADCAELGIHVLSPEEYYTENYKTINRNEPNNN